MPKKKTTTPADTRLEGIIGVATDAEDGHQRITRMERMVLYGGSAETHERMQETAIRFTEELEKRGKTLPEATVREALEVLREAIERTGR
jgi:hypothetical protein